MKLAFIAICILLAVSVNASFRKPVTSVKTQGKKDFEFHVFASEWAGSVCTKNKCGKEDASGVAVNFWNIHGLWPSDGFMGLNYCSDEKFDPSQLNSLKDDLTSYWSGLYSSADSFHGHEWEKHGTCSNMTQPEYFETVVQIAKDLDVYGALKRHNIIPGSQSYSCQQVANALQQTFGVTNFTLKATSGYLMELQICLTKDYEVRNCPKRNICNGNVKYPALNL